jgi:hypothetical protein
MKSLVIKICLIFVVLFVIEFCNDSVRHSIFMRKLNFENADGFKNDN